MEGANCEPCIEYFPYHTKKYDARLDQIAFPSQDYTFHLVKQAIERHAFIVHMRSRNSRWFKWIPKLEEYPYSAIVRNPQKPFVSPGHLPDDFDRIVAIDRDWSLKHGH
jgi:hypothetical protein